MNDPDRSCLRDEDWAAIAVRLRLSKREVEILRGSENGLHVGQVALTLGISPHTVRTYRRRIFQKLGTCDMLQTLVVVFRAYVMDDASRRVKAPGSPEALPAERAADAK